jgi:hypothetical protein
LLAVDKIDINLSRCNKIVICIRDLQVEANINDESADGFSITAKLISSSLSETYNFIRIHAWQERQIKMEGINFKI